MTDENSDSESEAEERAKGAKSRTSLTPFHTSLHILVNNHTVCYISSLPAHRQRLVSVQSILSQPRQTQAHYNGTNRKSSLEKDLHQRRLFEYFLVVSLQKSKAGAHYVPEVTQQFPPKVRTRVVLHLWPNFFRVKCVQKEMFVLHIRQIKMNLKQKQQKKPTRTQIS